MAKKQTRRSISVMGKTYRRLAVLCERLDRSVSGYLEELIAPHIADIDDPGIQPKVRAHDPGPQGPREQDPVADLRAIDDAFGPRYS